MKGVVILSARGEDWMKAVTKDLKSMGYEMTETRIQEAKTLAHCLTVHEELAKYVTKHGTTQTANSGYKQVSPEFTNMNNIQAAILRHKEKLGFYKIEKQPDKDEPKSDLDKLLG